MDYLWRLAENMESTTEQEVENHEAENKDTNIVLS
jgi:hypothetical protein